MPDTINPREFGRLEAQVESLTNQIESLNRSLGAMANQVSEMRDALAQAKGGWKTALTMIGISGTVGAILAKLIPLAVR